MVLERILSFSLFFFFFSFFFWRYAGRSAAGTVRSVPAALHGESGGRTWWTIRMPYRPITPGTSTHTTMDAHAARRRDDDFAWRRFRFLAQSIDFPRRAASRWWWFPLMMTLMTATQGTRNPPSDTKSNYGQPAGAHQHKDHRSVGHWISTAH